MELDVLYAHIASPTVVAHFAALAQRVAQRELPHEADIMIGIHTRLLKAHHPFALKPAAPAPTLLPATSLGPPGLVKTDVSTSDAPQAEDEHKTGLSPV
ncbi:hypothetical protein JVT61DRAFT_3786 [Boletus reticuloceps]|uniref:Uncharacterized protein n=1 Tax=Boletus reticuloceps TaxID=495285 RepID=A0A8I2YQB6_9AGAM|nr:hypothetical protein JVT61DRAFT_3786 [Boletus reticuloceps]